MGGVRVRAAVAGCGGVQSALDPAGREAEAQRYSLLVDDRRGNHRLARCHRCCRLVYPRTARGAHPMPERLMIVGAGAVAPTVVLTVLLVYGLAPIFCSSPRPLRELEDSRDR